jgi:hypothetical protein
MAKMLLPLVLMFGLMGLWMVQPTWDKYSTVTVTTCTAPESTAGFYDPLTTPQGVPFVVPEGKDGYITSVWGHASTHGAAHSRFEIGYAPAFACNSETLPPGTVVLAAWVEHDYPEQARPIEFQIGPIPEGMVAWARVDNEPFILNAEIVLR